MTHKINILFVIHNYGTGGVPSSLSCLYNYIKDDYNVSVMSLSREGHLFHSFIEALIPGYFGAELYFTRLTSLNGIRKLGGFIIKVIKKMGDFVDSNLESYIYKKTADYINIQYKFDIVISFQDRITARLCPYIRNAKTIAWIHCDYPRIMSSSGDNEMFQTINKIVCVSAYTANNFKKHYSGLADKVSYIYNILDTERIVNMSKEPINNPKFQNDIFTIVSIGRLSHLKRMYFIPEIAAYLKKSGCDFRWYILGGGDDKKEHYLINENIQKYAVEKEVIMLGNQTNPYSYLNRSQLLVSLSETEACPMIFNEARILGIPIVSADFGSSYEFIRNNEDGIIRPIDDIGIEITNMIKNEKYYNYFKIHSNNIYIDNNEILQNFDNLINRTINQ